MAPSGPVFGAHHRLGDQARKRVGHRPRVELVAARHRDRRRARRRSPANAPRRSKITRSSSPRSWYDHSTVARRVWWRSTRPRRLPVRSRNRSSRCPAISTGLIDDRPRRGELDRQRDAVDPPADLADRGPLPMHPIATRRPRRWRDPRTGAPRRSRCRSPSLADGSGVAERTHAHHVLARRRRVPHGSSPTRSPSGSAARPRRRTRRRRRAGARSCRARATAVADLQVLDDARRPGTGPGAAGTPTSTATPGPSRRRHRRRPARRTTHRRRSGATPRRPPAPRGASCPRRRCPVNVTSRASSSNSTTRRDVVVAPDERRHLRRQVAGERVQRPQRREVSVELGMHDLEDPLGSRQVA